MGANAAIFQAGEKIGRFLETTKQARNPIG
jgi:hypothetical protein